MLIGTIVGNFSSNIYLGVEFSKGFLKIFRSLQYRIIAIVKNILNII